MSGSDRNTRLATLVCAWLGDGHLLPSANAERQVQREHTAFGSHDGRHACHVLLDPLGVTPAEFDNLMIFFPSPAEEVSPPATWSDVANQWLLESSAAERSEERMVVDALLGLMARKWEGFCYSGIHADTDLLRTFYEATACVFMEAADRHDPRERTHSEEDLRHSLPRRFRCLSIAQDVARTAVTLLGSARAAALIASRLRPELLPHRDGMYVHKAVEISRQPHRVVSGTGLWAHEAIVEGSLLVREDEPVVLWWRSYAARPEDWLTTHLEALRLEVLSLEDDAATSRDATQMYEELLSHLPLEETCRCSRDPGSVVSELCAQLQLHHRVIGITDIDVFKLGLPSYDTVGRCGDPGSWLPVKEDEAGKAIYRLIGFINHSCQPNALLVFPQKDAPAGAGNPTGTVCVIALRDIEAGEEITISYSRNMLLPQLEKTQVHGFVCGCRWCQDKTALLEGIRCMACSRLVFAAADEAADSGASLSKLGATTLKPSSLAHAFRHAADCPLFDDASDAAVSGHAAQIVAAEQLRKARATVEAGVLSGEGNSDDGGNSLLTAAYRQLMNLDNAAAPILLSMHYERLRLRFSIAAASVDASLSLQDSAALLQLVADLVEDIELLVPANYPLVTGLRMFYVFARGRHLRATAEEAEARTSRRGDTEDGDGCCGAVRAEAELMSRPYIRDAVLRGSVIKCLQEHYLQCVGWRERGLQKPDFLLTSFMARYPVELEVVGLHGLDDFDILSCLPVVYELDEEAEEVSLQSLD